MLGQVLVTKQTGAEGKPVNKVMICSLPMMKFPRARIMFFNLCGCVL